MRTFPRTEPQSNRPFVVNHGPCHRLIRSDVSSDLVDLGSTRYKRRDVVGVGGIPDRDSPITCRGRAAVQAHSLPLKHRMQIQEANPGANKTASKKRWSTLLKILEWSKLIIAVSPSTFSMLVRTNWSLSWIVRPLTGQICSGDTRRSNTRCKRFAKTLAKIC